jgi:hypothetical protein
MSEIMLHGVLNMPPELWNNDSPIDVMQRHSRYVQASKHIDELEADLTAAREELVETRKDFMCLAELLDGHDATECRMNLVRLKEQRDRLAEALEEITMCGDPMSDQIATEALQSLNQNVEVRHGAKDSDLD